MPYLLHTERLTLRPLTREDYAFMRSVHTNDEIMKYIGSGTPRSEEQSLVAIEKSLHYELEDARLGSWIIELKPQLDPIGILIIRPPATKEKIEGLEIGYLIVPSEWGKGYAQECVRAMVSYAHQHFGPTRVVALIEPGNAASRNVLVKTGFNSVGTTEYVDATNGQIHLSEVLEIPKHKLALG